LLRGRGRIFKKEGLTPLLNTPLKQGVKGKNPIGRVGLERKTKGVGEEDKNKGAWSPS